ncbi:MAG TPA: hypothetical protein VG269_03680 [Tepidisphaeraceae bacterium]|nr:hypothetical protein [Tepidisphaeraceae bacterium]
MNNRFKYFITCSTPLRTTRPADQHIAMPLGAKPSAVGAGDLR